MESNVGGQSFVMEKKKLAGKIKWNWLTLHHRAHCNIRLYLIKPRNLLKKHHTFTYQTENRCINAKKNENENG